jgi:hypothetical protein
VTEGHFDDPLVCWTLTSVFNWGCQYPNGIVAGSPQANSGIIWWTESQVGVFNMAYPENDGSVPVEFPDVIRACADGYVLTSDFSDGSNTKLWALRSASAGTYTLEQIMVEELPTAQHAAIVSVNASEAEFLLLDTGSGVQLWRVNMVDAVFHSYYLQDMPELFTVRQTKVAPSFPRNQILVADDALHIYQTQWNNWTVDDHAYVDFGPDVAAFSITAIAVDDGAVLISSVLSG